MAVNKASSYYIVLLVAFCALGVSGCRSNTSPPHVSYLAAMSQLDANGESRRLDVVADVRNESKNEYRDVKLTVTFMDHTEVEFSWDKIDPYGYRGGHEAVELKLPATKKDLLGGSFEPITDVQGITTLYATEVKGAVLVYQEPGKGRHETEVGLAVSNVIRESFGELPLQEQRRLHEREMRLQRLEKAVSARGARDASEESL